MQDSSSAQIYLGPEKLVFAIDCGATRTAVAFIHLSPGYPSPSPEFVCRWPGQEETECKVPTAIRYSRAGVPIAFGAEAEEYYGLQEDTLLVRYFKLLLHPPQSMSRCRHSPPMLPNGRSDIVAVYSDFLGFTFSQATRFFKATRANGDGMWARLCDTFEIVFAIPNAWNETQENKMIRALLRAGILQPGANLERVTFVTEAEAAVHFALLNASGVADSMRPGSVFTVIDAGGSTVDTAIYRCDQLNPLRLSEIAPSSCVQAGSIYVNSELERLLSEKWAAVKSRKSDPLNKSGLISAALQRFEQKMKKTYDQGLCIIRLENMDKFTDPRLSIRNGSLVLSANEMDRVFRPSIESIQMSVCQVTGAAQVACPVFILVGGYSESPVLRRELKELPEFSGKQWMLSSEPAKKAAAAGALLRYPQECVVARALRYTYGISIDVEFDRKLVSHRSRQHLCYRDADNRLTLGNHWDTLVNRGDIVQQHQYFIRKLYRVFDHPNPDLREWSQVLLVSDQEKPGYWARTNDGELAEGIRTACRLTADLSALRHKIKACPEQGAHYWKVSFELHVYFGRKSLSAHLAWEDEGAIKYGPVSVIPAVLDEVL
ncbi:hypothetical protein BKA62DRAFT_773174 [Auriculariales sp. MPI-PUGE-AT-0066]|nr:hypothetical protein BKA62DRAFT_773174 [Auriculariales sp. MPI-PUGE-AT-0066]